MHQITFNKVISQKNHKKVRIFHKSLLLQTSRGLHVLTNDVGSRLSAAELGDAEGDTVVRTAAAPLWVGAEVCAVAAVIYGEPTN